MNGLGYDEYRDKEMDCNCAVEYYEKAAKQGHVGAQYSLGNCYDEGKGIVQDYEKATEWYEKAAKQGHAENKVT